MSDSEKPSGNAIEEAIINLRYKLLNEEAYKKFDRALASLQGKGKQTKTIAVNVAVNSAGLNRLKRQLDSLRSSVGVDIGGNNQSRVTRGKRGSAADDFVGPPRPVPITRRPPPASEFVGPPRPVRIDRPTPSVTITVDQIKRLGDVARAAADSMRGAGRNAAGRMGGANDFALFNRNARGARNRLDPFGADYNADAFHRNRDFSGMRFNRAAPDLSRMSFSPVGGASRRSRISPPDMTAFKGAIERLKEWSVRAGRQVERALSVTPKANTSKMKGSLRDAMGVLGVGALAAGAAQTLDEAQHLEDQIRALTPTIEDATSAQKGLFEASKATNSSYKTAVDIYSALAVMKDKTKLDPSQAVEVVRSIQAASQIGGGSAAGQERAIAQVEKAIAMNKLTVIGLNSIERQSRGITVALSEGLGVTVADLRKMAHEGKIGAEEISQALLKMAPEMQKRLGKVRVTLGNLGNYARTVMLEWATKLSGMWDGWGNGMAFIRNAMDGLNSFMLRAFDKLSSILGGGENAAKAVQYAFLSLGGGAVLAAIATFGGAVLAALWPVAIAAGAVFAAILAIDDVMGWIAGKKSVMGDLVGPFENFKPVFDDISSSFGELGKAWTSLWSDGLGDALNKEDADPPMARSFRKVLEAVNDTIKSLKDLVGMLESIKNGDYGSALSIAGKKFGNFVAEGKAGGLSALYNASTYLVPSIDPTTAAAAKMASFVSPSTPSQQDRREQIMRQSSVQQTINNSPIINVSATSADPEAIGRGAADAVSNALKAPMLPTSERGPR